MTPFAPTHRVPAGGTDSWPRPDANAPQGPHIDEGLLVQTTDRVGDWAKVVFDNGWTAWVDARRLAPLHATTRPGAPAGAARLDLAGIVADRSRAAGIGGAIVLAVASLLPWLRGSGQSVDSHDVRAAFLVDHETTAQSGLTVGVLLILIAVAIVIAVVTRARPAIARGLGVAALAVPALYLVQLQRLVSSAPGASLTDFIGFGSVLALAGAALVLVAPRLATSGAHR